MREIDIDLMTKAYEKTENERRGRRMREINLDGLYKETNIGKEAREIQERIKSWTNLEKEPSHKVGDIIFIRGIVVDVFSSGYEGESDQLTVYVEDSEGNYGRFIIDEREGGLIYGRSKDAKG